MLFILEKENKISYESDIESLLLQRELKKHKVKYKYHKTDDFYKIVELGKFKMRDGLLPKWCFPQEYQDAIPVGGIPFVESFMKIFHDVDMEYSIEVPPILRTDEFLKRKYSIIHSNEIPKNGEYFIKDATQLKVFSYKGELSRFLYDGIFTPKEFEFDNGLRLNPQHLFQVSEIVNVLSEYRTYIIGDEIVTISFYSGNPCIFPNTELIDKARKLYATQENHPHSYSMDVMVTDRGTAINEIHNFTSLGLYHTLWNKNLIQAYKEGIDYLINYNTKPTTFSNFDTFNTNNL